MGKLHYDLSFQSRCLLNRFEIRLTLIRSNDLFCLHRNKDQAQNRVSLKEVTLFVRKVKPNPAVRLAHVKALQYSTAKYPFRRVKVKSLTVPIENQSITKETCFWGNFLFKWWSVWWTTTLTMGLLSNLLSISSITASIS